MRISSSVSWKRQKGLGEWRAISANGHGNVGLRVPAGDEMYFTTPPTLNGLGPDGIDARIGLDGTLREGNLPPIQGAVASMHAAIYTRTTPTSTV